MNRDKDSFVALYNTISHEKRLDVSFSKSEVWCACGNLLKAIVFLLSESEASRSLWALILEPATKRHCLLQGRCNSWHLDAITKF